MPQTGDRHGRAEYPRAVVDDYSTEGFGLLARIVAVYSDGKINTQTGVGGSKTKCKVLVHWRVGLPRCPVEVRTPPKSP